MYEAGKFSPAQVTIKKGDTVVFQNKSDVLFWPASNLHPSHGLYPEFDPKQGIPPGESWSFTFENPGRWRFHDHLQPVAAGEIYVLDSVNTQGGSVKDKVKLLGIWDEVEIKIAKGYYYFFPDYLEEDFSQVNILDASNDHQKVLGSWIKIVGVGKVLDKLMTDTGSGERIDCHQQAHNIGRVSYSVIGVESFAEGNSSCHSGFYHGLIEEFFRQEGTSNLAQKVDTLCNSFPTTFGTFECLHGIGHGVMAYFDYDLPKALDECKLLKDAFSQESCFGGVFMENVVLAEGRGANAGHATSWVSDDPYFPCNGVDSNERLQLQCYLMQTSRMLDLNNHDFSKVIPLCEKAPENMRHTCFQSLGRDIAGQVLRDPERINSICTTISSQYYSDCMKGSLYVIMEFWGERITSQSDDYCKIQPDFQSKKECYTLAGSRLNDIFGKNTQKKNETCKLAKEEILISSCLGEK